MHREGLFSRGTRVVRLHPVHPAADSPKSCTRAAAQFPGPVVHRVTERFPAGFSQLAPRGRARRGLGLGALPPRRNHCHPGLLTSDPGAAATPRLLPPALDSTERCVWPHDPEYEATIPSLSTSQQGGATPPDCAARSWARGAGRRRHCRGAQRVLRRTAERASTSPSNEGLGTPFFSSRARHLTHISHF